MGVQNQIQKHEIDQKTEKTKSKYQNWTKNQLGLRPGSKSKSPPETSPTSRQKSKLGEKFSKF